jgi:hypothetical protein
MQLKSDCIARRLFPLLLLVSAFVLDSCKKGDNDPAISFRTRKNRLTGEWRLRSGTYKHNTQGTSGPEGYHVKFTESQYTYVVDIPGSIYTGAAQGPYSRTMSFKKDGYVRIVELIDGFEYVTEGTWDFNSGVGDEKSKELVTIHFTYYSSSSGTQTYGGNQKQLTYTITELRNKKLVLNMKDQMTDVDGTREDISETIELKQ